MATASSSSTALVERFNEPQKIRNVCVIAHVDHGKTTLTDSLLASNGIISERSAGLLRFLDSRGDERERFITMKSSAISLRWGQGKTETLVNLVDSPGHVDFGSEVNTAARLADGALVVVDVVEGVSSQTKAVLRQAWKDDLKTILVLNKMDRLQNELFLSPDEAFEHLNRILEQVNAATLQLVTENQFEENQASDDEDEERKLGDQHEILFDSEVEAKWTYHPSFGNVIFCSAVHGWGFSISTFVDIVAQKLQCNKETLRKTMWGDYAYQPKTKKIIKRPPGSSMRPLFSQFCLDIIWKVYNATSGEDGTEVDTEFLKKIQPQLGFDCDVDNLKINCTKQILSPWLPLSTEILNRIIDCIPDPSKAAASRLPHFVPLEKGVDTPLYKSLLSSDRHGPLGAMVTKFLLADAANCGLVSDDRREGEELPTDFLGLARVFSGTIKVGQRITYAERNEAMTVTKLYLVMGMELIPINEAYAGTVCGILFAERSTAQYMTLIDSSSEWIPIFRSPYPNLDTTSIVTVALRTNVEHLESLMTSLQMLRRTDPAVDVRVMETGEYTIGCSGNEHLKRCLHDLETIFCPEIPFTASEPLVSCRETVGIVPEDHDNSALSLPWDKRVYITREDVEPEPVWDAPVKKGKHEDSESEDEETKAEKLDKLEQEQKRKKAVGVTLEPNGAITLVRQSVSIRVRAYTCNCDKWIDTLDEDSAKWDLEEIENNGRNIATQYGLDTISSENFSNLVGICNGRGSRTLLLNGDSSFPWKLTHSYRRRRRASVDENEPGNDGGDEEEEQGAPSSCGISTTSSFYNRGHLCSALIAGFNLASQSGPLCEEPLRNVAFVLEKISLDGTQDVNGVSGQVMYAAKEALRQSMLRYKNFIRIEEPILLLDLQAEQEVLGKVYSVLHKRKTKILSEDLRDGTNTFLIVGNIPLQESFGLVDEIRTKASGLAHFSSWFSHWQTLDEDPFYETNLKLEDHEDNGEAGSINRYPHNTSRKLLVSIRKRKGLVVDEKVLSQDSTKQRTMTKMK